MMNATQVYTNQLDTLKKWTTIVADTGDIQSIKAFTPQDATTNPTLIFKAVQSNNYNEMLEKAIADNDSKGLHIGSGLIDQIIDSLLVYFGVEILKIIPGRVSTEVNAHLSFNTQGTIEKARKIIQLYEDKNITKDRVLIKIASTWEGIQAARQLEKEGIHCNMTLLFSLAQAVACAESGAKLISPFVGRITDWYKKNSDTEFTPENDPGVESVKNIYKYYKKFRYKTEIMGASFRNTGQILELAGCDLLTISPSLLQELQNNKNGIEEKLTPHLGIQSEIQKIETTEGAFRWHMNSDAMATEKLAEGIRRFDEDTTQLAKLIETEIINR